MPGNYEIEDSTELSGEEEEVCCIKIMCFCSSLLHCLPVSVAFRAYFSCVVLFCFQLQEDDEEEDAKPSNLKAKNAKNGKKN